MSDRDSTEYLSGAIFWPKDTIGIEEEAGSKVTLVCQQITKSL
jgi:hypothetical protein